ncbi:MAG: diaminopimelate epimerase [Bacteroidota bacterium]
MSSHFSFSKYHGTGNDFIMIDDRTCSFNLSTTRIHALCNRRFGIGADGLILIRPSDKADFQMVYFNADGGEGSMCGNGARCASAFAYRIGLGQKEIVFEGVDGMHTATLLGNDIVKLRMNDVKEFKQRIGFSFVDTGSPHLVIPASDLESVDVNQVGKKYRHDVEFAPGGTNVNFIEFKDEGLFVRTFERGVEGETLSCGTGVTAVALVAHRNGWVASDADFVDIRTRGGDLKVFFKPDPTGGYRDIFLQGPAVHVFDGQFC